VTPPSIRLTSVEAHPADASTTNERRDQGEIVIDLTPEQIADRAAEAYSYLYPLVTMDVTRAKFTDPERTGIGHGPVNTLTHLREFPPADFRGVVAPNFDTLYTSAWLDLSAGPLVIEVPDSEGRYYLLPLLDMWTNAFAVPGKRTTGTGPQRIAIVPPRWTGPVPTHTRRIDAPTTTLWMIGRVQTNGPADYDAVHVFQDGLRLRGADGGVPASGARSFAGPAGLDFDQEPLTIVNGLDAVDFLAYGARLLAEHRPQPTDFSILARIAELGLVAGAEFGADGYTVDQLGALRTGAADALARQHAMVSTMARISNGWSMNTDSMGVYGNFYLKRAVVAMVGLGANPPEDAIYPIAVADAAGNPIIGEKDYVQHFDADLLPPVDAFWSATMYDADSFQSANALDRFALGDRDPLFYNADGSLDMYYGPTDPGGEATANWLPAPAGPLRIIMRLYAPRPAALDGRWNPPALIAR
jgi:hypothetical protein